jgi:hypothetical protein
MPGRGMAFILELWMYHINIVGLTRTLVQAFQ